MSVIREKFHRLFIFFLGVLLKMSLMVSFLDRHINESRPNVSLKEVEIQTLSLIIAIDKQPSDKLTD